MENDQVNYGSRGEALAAGWKVYHPGFTCRLGHDSPRYTSSSNCVECHKIRKISGFQRLVLVGPTEDIAAVQALWAELQAKRLT